MNTKLFNLKQLLIMFLLTITPISITLADDTKADGATLHKKSCIGCHINMAGGDGTSMYTRKDRRVSSFSALEPMVRRCDANIGLELIDDQIFAIRDFLNTNYYKYPATPVE